MDTKEIIEECRKKDGGKISVTTYPIVDGWNVWRWKEFQAFLTRLGVPIEPPVTRMSITIPVDGLVKIITCMNGSDGQGEGKAIELDLD